MPDAGRRPPYLFVKIGLLLAGLLIGFSFLVGTLGISFFSHALRDQAEKRGKAVASSLSSSLVEIVAARQNTAVSRALREVREEAGLAYIEIIDADGEVFAHSDPGPTPPKRRRAVRLEFVEIQDDVVDGTPIIDVPDRMPMGYVVHVGVDATALQARIGLARWTVIGLTTVEVLVALLAAFLVVRPHVRDLSRANKQLEENLGRLEETQSQLRLELEAKQKAQEELRQASAAAEAANRAKSFFLANMSHEIRTPMNGILGMTELALNTKLNRDQREYLRAVKTSGDALLAVINDILDLSKIEAGKLELNPVDFPLRETLLEGIRPLAARAHPRGLELAVDVDARVDDWVHGDPVRLKQIIVNLVGNAIKFTERGEIVLYCRLLNADSGPENGAVSPASAPQSAVCNLELSVRDTGIGIPSDKQSQLFTPFTQADASTTRKYGGTGLGLAISKRLVQMMGGRIWIESEPDKGTTFRFSLDLPPGKTAPPARRAAADAELLRGLPVLIVDDNATNRRILEEMTRAWGMKPAALDGGQAALQELILAAEAGRPYPVVLLDGMMPEMDGPMTALEIRKIGVLKDVKIILLTSADLLVDEARCEELGLTDYLVKPVSSSDLQTVLIEALSSARGGEPAQPSGQAGAGVLGSGRALHILLAEDNLVNQMLAMTLLKKQGHTVELATDGRKVLEALERTAFDVVLMDVQMPHLDGFEATRIIREREKGTGQRVRIVALTANAMKGDREECLAQGMDDYLSKPIEAKDLADVIERVALLPSR